ncbi:MAG: polymorphic toxin type 50 domain-containing protein [Firmicutes bacterium]|nr:polymorphic toxin type 50 domain-containing protein [Bacillota bacterium]
MNDEIYEYIKSDEVDKTINPEKQGRHILGHPNYIEGRSYFFDWVNPQELVDKYHGTGDVPKHAVTGKWYNKEFVSVGKDIGVDIDRDSGIQAFTDRISIHYSKTGTHVVPVERR